MKISRPGEKASFLVYNEWFSRPGNEGSLPTRVGMCLRSGLSKVLLYCNLLYDFPIANFKS